MGAWLKISECDNLEGELKGVVEMLLDGVTGAFDGVFGAEKEC